MSNISIYFDYLSSIQNSQIFLFSKSVASNVQCSNVYSLDELLKISLCIIDYA